MPTANWPVSAIFILSLFLPPVNIINLIHTCLRTDRRRQAVRVSRNICTMVNLFDKAVAEGRDNHCGNEV